MKSESIDEDKFQDILAVEFAKLAFSLRRKEDFVSRLAAVLIYSNFIEYLLEALIRNLHLEIRCICLEKKLKQKNEVSFTKYNNVLKNKESLKRRIEHLNQFEFPNKNRIIEIFDILRLDRNDVIHKLIKAKSEGKNIDASMQRMFENIDKITTLLSETSKTIMRNH